MSTNQNTPPRTSPSSDHAGDITTGENISIDPDSPLSPSASPSTSTFPITTTTSTSTGRSGSYPTTPTWTDVQEERLIYVQAELKKAQKRWSESQNIWLDEEHRLQELKRHHKKHTKHTKLTQTPPPRPAFKSLSWRLKSWRSKSLSESGTATPAEGSSHSPTTLNDGLLEPNSPTTDLFASTNHFASHDSPEAGTPDEHDGEDSDALPSPPPLGQQRRRLTWSTTPSFPPTLTRAATFASAAGSSSGISQAHGKGGNSRKGRLGDALRRMSFSGRRGSAV